MPLLPTTLQCSKFHLLDEFDEERHSCRASLGRHQERRRLKRQQSDDEQQQAGKRKHGSEGGQQARKRAQPPGSQPPNGKRHCQRARSGAAAASQRNTAAQPAKATRQGEPGKQRPRKPSAAPKQPSQKKQQHAQQHAQQQQQRRRRRPAQQRAHQAGLPSSLPSTAAAQQRQSNPPQLQATAAQQPQQQEYGSLGSAAPRQAALGSELAALLQPPGWPAAQPQPTSAEACTNQWQSSGHGFQQMAAIPAVPPPRPDSVLLGAVPATWHAAGAFGLAGGHGCSLEISGSLEAEIEALLRFEEPLLPDHFGPPLSSSSSWLCGPLVAGPLAAQPLQHSPCLAPLAAQQAQQMLQQAPPLPQGPSSLPAGFWPGMHAPPAVPLQQQQQQPQPGFAGAASWTAVAWGSMPHSSSVPHSAAGGASVGGATAVVGHSVMGHAPPAVPAAVMPPCSLAGDAANHLAAPGSAAPCPPPAEASSAVPQPWCFSGRLVTTGSGVQP